MLDRLLHAFLSSRHEPLVQRAALSEDFVHLPLRRQRPAELEVAEPAADEQQRRTGACRREDHLRAICEAGRAQPRCSTPPSLRPGTRRAASLMHPGASRHRPALRIER
jgi:hypothetical protein